MQLINYLNVAFPHEAYMLTICFFPLTMWYTNHVNVIVTSEAECHSFDLKSSSEVLLNEVLNVSSLALLTQV